MSAICKAVSEIWPLHSSHWLPSSMPDMTGKVVIVTGGYGGIGYETCKALLEHNADVYILGRSASKAEVAIKSLKDATGKDIIGFLSADLGDLNSVRTAADEFQRKEKHLNVLFNNAGVMFPPAGSRTTQGYEAQFGTNVLSHYHLTTLLLPSLLNGYHLSGQKSRVINTSSLGHDLLCPTGGIQYDQLKPELMDEKDILGVQPLYGISKMGNVMFANELNKRYESQGIISNSLNPGLIRSELSRHTGTAFIRNFTTRLSQPAFKGAYNLLWLGTSEEGASLGGKYVIPWCRVAPPRPEALDAEKCEELFMYMKKECEGF